MVKKLNEFYYIHCVLFSLEMPLCLLLSLDPDDGQVILHGKIVPSE